MRSEISQLFTFQAIFRETKWQIFLTKNIKCPILGPFLPKYEQNWILCKIKPSKQSLLRKMLNWLTQGYCLIVKISNFIKSSVYRDPRYKGNLTISYHLNIFLIYHSEVIWACLFMPDQVQLILLLICKKSTSFLNSFLGNWTLLNLPIWLVESSSGNNSKSRILPDINFGVTSQVSQ